MDMTMRVQLGITIATLAIISAASRADTLTLDFESESLGGTTPPAGWSMVTANEPPTPTYTTTNGASGVGLGGQVTGYGSSTALPGGYLVSSGTSPFATTLPISGSFDFYIYGGESPSYKNAHFLFGDIQTGIEPAQSNRLLCALLQRNSFGNKAGIVDGEGTRISDTYNLSADTWYTVNFNWTPTSGTTGDFSYSCNGWTATVTDFTFSQKEAYFGFGTAGYWSQSNYGTAWFDNISITGSSPDTASTVFYQK